MTGERKQPSGGLAQQQEQVVQHYAGRLKEIAVAEGRRIARGEGTRKAYEILNECALELAELSRRATPRNGDAAN